MSQAIQVAAVVVVGVVFVVRLVIGLRQALSRDRIVSHPAGRGSQR
jgi:uncharacterized membrane protein